MVERPAYISERNWAIYQAFEAGTTLSALAHEYGVTRQRVSQLTALVMFRLEYPPRTGKDRPEPLQKTARRWRREHGLGRAPSRPGPPPGWMAIPLAQRRCTKCGRGVAGGASFYPKHAGGIALRPVCNDCLVTQRRKNRRACARFVEAARLRQQGMKLREIGAHFGVSKARAGQLVARGNALQGG